MTRPTGAMERVLAHIAASGKPLTFADISEGLGLPAKSVKHALADLMTQRSIGCAGTVTCKGGKRYLYALPDVQDTTEVGHPTLAAMRAVARTTGSLHGA